MKIKDFKKGEAHVRVFDTRLAMGTCAGQEIGQKIRELQAQKPVLNIMFAAAPSQNEVLSQLLREEGIDWKQIRAFHMDEYIDIHPDHPAGFASFLKRSIFSRLPFKEVHYLNCSASDPHEEAKRYAQLLTDNKLDICILGVGENGHIAFNEPSVANFDDAFLVKVVELEERCRQQQVNDGCFASIDQVPTKAITVTIPGMLSADYMFCSVPCSTKAEAVRKMLTDDISTTCPASILRNKAHAKIYLDADSAKEIL